MGKTLIMLIDDHEVIRDGLKRMLSLEEDMEVIGEASNAKEALEQIKAASPEIILMDVKMPGVDGIQLTEQIMDIMPSVSIIMLTLYEEHVKQAIEAGAIGYLLKDIKRHELVKSIRSAKEGLSPLAMSVRRDRLADLYASSDETRPQLSEREITILDMIASGITTRELAGQLFLSEASVKRSVGIIFDKLEVRNRFEAVAEACKRGIISPHKN